MITIGIDVSKDKLDILWLRDITSKRAKAKIFKNNASGHQALVNWVENQTKAKVEEINFVMEATGVYHEPLAYALFEQGSHVFVINPARIKAHATSLGQQGKTDKKDSFAIAHYGAMHVDASVAP
jgi:transposase